MLLSDCSMKKSFPCSVEVAVVWDLTFASLFSKQNVTLKNIQIIVQVHSYINHASFHIIENLFWFLMLDKLFAIYMLDKNKFFIELVHLIRWCWQMFTLTVMARYLRELYHYYYNLLSYIHDDLVVKYE